LNNEERKEIIDLFSKNLSRDLSKRKKELVSLKSQIEKIENNSDKFIKLRVTYPMFFVHYEGYLNTIKEFIFDYFKKANLKVEDLKKEILVFYLSVKVNGISNSKSQSKKIYESIKSILNNDESFFIESKNFIIDYQGIVYFLKLLGLNEEELNYNLTRYNVSDDVDFISEKSINEIPTIEKKLKSIYKVRNYIVHGQIDKSLFSIPDIRQFDGSFSEILIKRVINEWNSTYNFVMTLFDYLTNLVTDYLIDEKYLYE
jgi:hypothetical protein